MLVTNSRGAHGRKFALVGFLMEGIHFKGMVFHRNSFLFFYAQFDLQDLNCAPFMGNGIFTVGTRKIHRGPTKHRTYMNWMLKRTQKLKLIFSKNSLNDEDEHLIEMIEIAGKLKLDTFRKRNVHRHHVYLLFR